MGLIKCPDCGKEISDQAPACIHCGRPKDAAPPKPPPPPARKRPKAHAVLSIAGGVAMALGLACLVAGRSGWAAAFLAPGLAMAIVGGVWSWLARD